MKKKKRIPLNELMEKAWTGELSGADLRGLSLKKVNLEGAVLPNADLSGVNLSGADLRSADLRGANLKGARLSRADLSGACLTGADLSDGELIGALLEKTAADKADFTHADLTEATVRHSNLTGARLSCVLAAFCKIESTRLTDAVMIDGEFSESRIRDTDLNGSDLTGATFFHSTFENVSAINSRAVKTDFSFSRLANVQFTDTDLARSNFLGAFFDRVVFQGADVRWAKIHFTRGLAEEDLGILKEKGARISRPGVSWLLSRILHSKENAFRIGIPAIILVGLLFVLLAIRINLVEQVIHQVFLQTPKPYRSHRIVGDADFTILCVGDCHTSREGLKAKTDYPSQLEALLNTRYPELGFRVENLGFLGANSSMSVIRLDKALQDAKDRRLDLVIFSSGKNNGHRMTDAGFLPPDIRSREPMIFAYLLEKKDEFHFGRRTVSNLEKLIQRGVRPSETGWGEVLDEKGRQEQQLLYQWITADLLQVKTLLDRRKIKLVLMNYYHPVPWVDDPYAAFSMDHQAPFVSILNFGLPDGPAGTGPFVKDFRPNGYGNRRIVDILFKALVEGQILGPIEPVSGTTIPATDSK